MAKKLSPQDMAKVREWCELQLVGSAEAVQAAEVSMIRKFETKLKTLRNFFSGITKRRSSCKS